MVNLGAISYKIRYKWNKFKIGIQRQLFRARDLVVFYLPSDNIRDLPKSQALPVGLVAVSLLLAMVIGLLVATLTRNLTTAYLALEEDSNSICEDVLKPMNDIVTSDMNGYWEGNKEFNYSNALYVYEAHIKRDLASYQEAVRYMLDNTMSRISASLQVNNLGINMLLMVTFQFITQSDDGAETDIFHFKPDPSTLFKSQVYSASAATVDSLCDTEASIEYDRANALMKINFAYVNFANSSVCMNVFDPAHMGYDAQWSGGKISIDIDINALTTVLAVNLDMLPTDSFEALPSNPYGSDYGGTKYIYTRFPSMSSFLCFTNPQNITQYFCTIEVGTLLMIPIFNHAGNSHFAPEYCSCDNELLANSQLCNKFDFLSGFVFYDYNSSETSQSALEPLFELMFGSSSTDDVTSNAFQVNRNAFDISYDANNPSSVTRGNDTWKRDHYEFCRSSSGKYCSILSFYMSSSDYSITEYHFPLYNGSCNDFVSVSEEAKMRMINNPPTELVEVFVTCKRTMLAAINDSVGVVSGNVTALTPVLMAIIFYLYLYGYIKWKRVKQDVTYSKLELETIGRFLAFNLALVRDGIHPTQAAAKDLQSVNEQHGSDSSVLLRLLEELKQEDVCKRFHAPLNEDLDEDENSKHSFSSENPMQSLGSNPAENNDGGLELKDVEGGRGSVSSRKRKKKKKKMPVKTDPDVLLNPFKYRLKY